MLHNNYLFAENHLVSARTRIQLHHITLQHSEIIRIYLNISGSVSYQVPESQIV